MFRFGMLDKVEIEASKEVGVVIGRAEYANCENQYLVRYADGTGSAVQKWWDESALVAAI